MYPSSINRARCSAWTTLLARGSDGRAVVAGRGKDSLAPLPMAKPADAWAGLPRPGEMAFCGMRLLQVLRRPVTTRFLVFGELGVPRAFGRHILAPLRIGFITLARQSK
jgi:hypothetical protein